MDNEQLKKQIKRRNLVKKYTAEDIILAMRHAGNFAAKWVSFEPGRPVYNSDIDKEALKYLEYSWQTKGAKVITTGKGSKDFLF